MAAKHTAEKQAKRKSKAGGTGPAAEWNRKALLTRSRRTVFSKGLRPWLLLSAVCFLFSFLGASGASSSSFVETLDQALGLSLSSQNMELLRQSLEKIPFIQDLRLLDSDLAMSFIHSLLKNYTWLINLLGANAAYFQRNVAAVAALLYLVSVLAFLYRFLFQNMLVLGRNRYVMENRQAQRVRFGRSLAPFHRKMLGNEILVMLRYHLTLLLWSLTIVGGFYKYFQYCMVPYILAENPFAGWKEARALSVRMTDGYKRKLFATKLSVWYVLIAKAVPVLGTLAAVPFEATLDAELYFELRARVLPAEPADDPALQELLPERTFDLDAYVDSLPEADGMAAADSDRQTAVSAAAGGDRQATVSAAAGHAEGPAAVHRKRHSLQPGDTEGFLSAPAYLLDDLPMLRPDAPAYTDPYRLTDYILMFFLFAGLGWLWEVFYGFIKLHIVVNRGVLIGPWLPIYGAGGVMCILLLNRYKKNSTRTFLLIMVLAGIMEYLTSWALDYFDNSHYWDYHSMFANLNGRVCLAGLLVFGVGGSLAIYVVGPALRDAFRKVGKKRCAVISAVLCLLFAADVLYCLKNGFNTGTGVGGLY